MIVNQGIPIKEGILLVNKSPKTNSFYLVKVLRKITKVKKIGHAGTLDPFATGVMIMLIGKNYTKKSDSFLNQEKEYLATIHLGVSTDTFDIDGKVLQTSDLKPTLEQILKALTFFQGSVEQVPPMYSAKKVQGKKLYELARQGIEIERKSVIVNMKTDFIEYNYPKLLVKVTCSKGTYIRSIAKDLGDALGCGAHLQSLTRTRCGFYHLNECVDQNSLLNEDFILEQHLLNDANF